MKKWFKNLLKVKNVIVLKNGDRVIINNNSSYTDKEVWKWKTEKVLDFKNIKINTNDINYWYKKLSFRK